MVGKETGFEKIEQEGKREIVDKRKAEPPENQEKKFNCTGEGKNKQVEQGR